MTYLIKLLYCLLSGIITLYVFKRSRKRSYIPLPPGPTRYPIIGGLIDFPKHHTWLHFAKYKELYGSISYTSVFGQKFIILNDRAAAFDLLDERSIIYSDRPDFPFATMYDFT